MATQLAEVLNVTREQMAHNLHANATSAAHDLERQARKTFALLYSAREAMLAIGVSTDVQLSDGLAAAYMDYKVKQAKLR